MRLACGWLLAVAAPRHVGCLAPSPRVGRLWRVGGALSARRHRRETQNQPLLRPRPGHTPRAVTDGLDAEADGVGPGIYGGRVDRDDAGEVVIGQQFEEYNPIPGPVYAGGGYTEVGRGAGTQLQGAFEMRSGSRRRRGRDVDIPRATGRRPLTIERKSSRPYGHVAAAASPRLVSTEYPRRGRGVAATRLHGISTPRPRRRRALSPRNIHTSRPRRRRALSPRNIHTSRPWPRPNRRLRGSRYCGVATYAWRPPCSQRASIIMAVVSRLAEPATTRTETYPLAGELGR